MHERLKALSVRQPYAELILRGEKTVERRSQPTKTCGRIYIYALRALPDDDNLDNYDPLDIPLDMLPRGVIVGSVEITECEEGIGEYEWSLANPCRFETPLTPNERPQPVWFHPFGRPEDVYQGSDFANSAAADDAHTAGAAADAPSGATRFSPVVAAASEPPFTAYHSKYLAYELTKKVGADQADKLASRSATPRSISTRTRLTPCCSPFAHRFRGAPFWPTRWAWAKRSRRASSSANSGRKRIAAFWRSCPPRCANINFVNRANEADKRVFELLHEEFKLFDGVFGASDEVLGAVGSGIDIEPPRASRCSRCAGGWFRPAFRVRRMAFPGRPVHHGTGRQPLTPVLFRPDRGLPPSSAD